MNLTRFRAGAFALALILLPGLALAQRTPAYQDGTITPGTLLRSNSNGLHGSVGDILGRTVDGKGVNPFAILDNGDRGLCSYKSASGTAGNRLCLGHDASGNPTLFIDSMAGGSVGSPQINFNGAIFPLIASGGNGNVTGPNSSNSSSVPAFVDATGKVITDPGILYADTVNSQMAVGLASAVPPYVKLYINAGNSDTDATKNHAGTQSLFDWTASGDSDASPEGLYGILYLDAPRSFNNGPQGGAPAGIRGNAYTMPQLTYNITNGGSGYATGNRVTFTNGGASCEGLPQATVTASGGVITGLTQVLNSGICATFPGGTWTQSSTTGGGTGATVTITQGSITANNLSGVYGRCRHQGAGTVAVCASFFADPAQNAGPGSITKAVGVYIPGTNNTNQFGLLIGTSASPVHYVKSEGVAGPSWPFDVFGLADTGQTDHYIAFNDAYVSGARGSPLFSGGGANFGAYIRQTASNASSLAALEWGRIPFGNSQAATPLMVLDLLNARLGIGTTAPGTALDVVGQVHASTGFTSGAAAGLSVSVVASGTCTFTVTGGIVTAKTGC